MLRQVAEAIELLEDPRTDGAAAAAWVARHGPAAVRHERLQAERGSTDVVTVEIGAGAPCLGILGVLGGTGLRPERPGLVSDADGAVVALAVAAALAREAGWGDAPAGRVVVSTHVCPRALSRPHQPAPMMTCPVPRERVLAAQLDPAMEAVLAVDATRANRVVNHTGFAITPTVKEGWILKPSADLLGLMEWATGEPPVVAPLAMQDITPYSSGVAHINSMMQPATLTDAPVVGVALTARAVVAGSATGVNPPFVLEAAARFCREVARAFGAGRCSFHDAAEFERLVSLYGSMRHLVGPGRSEAATAKAATPTTPSAANSQGTGA